MIVKKSRKYSNRKNTNRKYSNRKLKKKLIGGEIIINNLDQLRELVLSKKLYVYQVSQPRPIFRAILLTNDANDFCQAKIYFFLLTILKRKL